MVEEATERLFDVGGLELPAPVSIKNVHTWHITARGVLIVGTKTQIQRAAAGRHPTSAFPFGESGTCGECAHLLRTGRNGSFLKCGLLREQTHGHGTDVKMKWPACDHYERAETADGK
jgi:hypothetical protein